MGDGRVITFGDEPRQIISFTEAASSRQNRSVKDIPTKEEAAMSQIYHDLQKFSTPFFA
ncbi:MAG: hypothetical protein QXH03_11120 [Candidatus Bathyarchaeia archaeon]